MPPKYKSKKARSKTYSKGKGTSRKTYKKTRNTVSSGNVGRYVAGAAGKPDPKFIDHQISHTLSTPGVWTMAHTDQTDNAHFFIVPQGTGPSGRIGNRVSPKTIHWKSQFTVPSTVVNDVTFHWLLVHDTQTNQKPAPVITDTLIIATPGAGGGTRGAKALVRMENSKRFRIVRRGSKCCPAPAGATASARVCEVEDFIVLPAGQQMNFASTSPTGLIGDVTDHSYTMWVCHSIPEGGTSASMLLFTVARAKYIDT